MLTRILKRFGFQFESGSKRFQSFLDRVVGEGDIVVAPDACYDDFFNS